MVTNMTRNFLILMVLLASLPLCTMAKMVMALQLELVNGKTVSFALDAKPVITFSRDSIEISEGGFATSYLRTEVSHYHFSLVDTSIGSVKGNEVQIVKTSPYIYKIEGYSGKVLVCNVAGIKYPNCVTNMDNEVVIDLGGLSTGVYIIKIGNLRTIKIAKK